jgi:asparagine synthase (glutamine-hydrolysing)
MASPAGLQLVFNGEIYNYVELRRELRDFPYRSGSDTEVILAAYEAWGEACVERFVGMFAFVLWDPARRRLFAARDRLGIKPLHLANHEGRLLIASEAKALFAAGVPCVPDQRTWATYLSHGLYDHSDATFFAGVRQLPPGTILLSDGKETTEERYWELADRASSPFEGTRAEADLELRRLLDEAVRLRLRSDVPVGVNLSGGLDSASLVATVDRVSDSDAALETFTAAFGDPRYDETEFAGRVQGRRAWTRNVRLLSPARALELALPATWHQEAPYGGVATLAYHELQREAVARGVTVLLEGQGMDELFAGYAYHLPAFVADLLEVGRGDRADAELAALGARGPRVRAQADALRRGEATGGYQDGTEFLFPECLSAATRTTAGEKPALPRPFPGHLRNALYADLRHAKLPRVLRMNDRLSMAASRELRVPFLDHRLVELAFRLPTTFLIEGGVGKQPLRRAMAGRLPDEVRLAGKRAVVSPQREWLRGPLAPLVEEIIGSASFADRGLFDVDAVRARWQRFRAGEGDNGFPVWQWVGTELWFRTFVDGGGK